MFDFLTIGYSNLAFSEFVSLCTQSGISAIADVRTSPFSRQNPDFSKDQLRLKLSLDGISYVFLGKELGARPSDPQCYVEGHVDYDRLSQRPFFAAGLSRLEKGSQQFRIALMCAEADPITCHRTILVAPRLVERGYSVGHIRATGFVESHDKAMSRLIDELGLRKQASANRLLTEQHAYKVQGKKLAYFDAKFLDNREQQENFL